MRKLLLGAVALLALTMPVAAAPLVDVIVAQPRANVYGGDVEPLLNLGLGGINAFTGVTAGAFGNVSFTSIAGGSSPSGLFAGNALFPSALSASVYSDGDSTRRYFTAGGLGGSVELTYAGGPLTELLILWGTVDDGLFRNRIVTGGGDVITGADVLARCALEALGCVNENTNVLVRITGLNPFNTATFSDANSNSFEFNVRAVEGVPEPATWAMMLLGFAGVGTMAMRRRRNAGRLLRLT